ncbi:mediator of RNA polymerase II transcription subunit 15a-like [Lolium rigidum]|uniref:mediator of RNA polymerase II transcription subunit 15a-like n=1 Tax=Lolium rigidum TaxID=89674 RepID=UPI001F5D33EF|nr:mediator of RNA polymerase II transcription subunit 15a-like [Lolium rigidum]
MDANRRLTQGSDPAAVGGGVDPNARSGGDWLLQPEDRSRVVNKIVETLRMHLPEGLDELQRIAVRLEESIYGVATNQADYLRKICLKMLSVEAETQQAPGNAQMIPNQNNPGQASEDSTAQTGHAGAGDWQEEIYQMIRSLKEQHFAELNELFNKLSVKLQHVDSVVPCPVPSELYERMKIFKLMLGGILKMLQISKSSIQPALRDMVPLYEKHIINILAARRFQPPTGQAPNSDISRQQQPSQNLQQHDSHTNPRASLSSMSSGLQSSSAAGIRHAPAVSATNFSVPTQQNGANIQDQAGSNSEAAQGSNFSSLRYGLMGGGLRQGRTGLMQVRVNAQQQTGRRSSSSMLSHLSGQRKHIIKRRWRDTF